MSGNAPTLVIACSLIGASVVAVSSIYHIVRIILIAAYSSTTGANDMIQTQEQKLIRLLKIAKRIGQHLAEGTMYQLNGADIIEFNTALLDVQTEVGPLEDE